MKARTYTLFAAAVMAALVIAGCSNEGIGRRRGREEPSEKYTENPNWTITYSGRSVSTDDGVYVIDVLHVQSSDTKQYYVDLIKTEEFNSSYGGSIANFIEGSYRNMDSNYLMTGDSDATYDRLDGGDGSWTAVAYEVEKNGSLGDEYSFLQFTSQEVTFRKTDTYKMSVKPRVTIDEIDDLDSRVIVDEVDVKTDSPVSYYVDIAYPEYISENYSGDPVGFFNDVLDNVAKGLSENEDFQGVIYKGDSQTQFDRLRSGIWTAYAFGVDYNGFLTGEWSEFNFTLKEDEATEEYKKWLGNWRIGDGKITYDIGIESSENNYYYLVTGWETGDNASEYANNNVSGYAFETFFDRNSGQMHFQSAYLGTLNDSNIGDFDVMFLGNIEYKGNVYSVTDENVPIATAALSEDGNNAEVTAAKVNVNISETEQYCTDFISMQFVDVTDSDLYTYNEEIPSFPMTMKRIGSSASSSGAAARMRLLPAGRRGTGFAGIATKSSVSGTSASARRHVGTSAVRGAKIATKSAADEKNGINVRLNGMKKR